jgi:decaprenyl-phosphate phosphoribosyltransferase
MTAELMTPTMGRTAVGLLHAVRPRQWVKNSLVVAAPLLSEQLLEAEVALATLVAFVAFCLASSGVYLVNDVRDREADRAHPRKRSRPIAAGVVSPPTAITAATVLFVASMAVALLADPALLVVLASYITLQLLYCLALKDQRVVDIAVIAAGFLLRAVAGGAATGIELSQWFLLAATFGALFLASGKRYAESRMEGDLATMRRSLAGYTQTYLRFVWTLSATMLTMTYGLWAFEMREASGSALPVLSMAPFLLAVLRYAIHVDAGEADAPEAIAWNDRVLQVLALLWVVTLLAAVWS